FCVTRCRSNINTKDAPRWLRLRWALCIKYPRKGIIMKILFSCILISLALTACSSKENSTQASGSVGKFPKLPTSSTEYTTLQGVMSFWMYEGAAGCYGTITDGLSEVNLWVSEDSCVEVNYSENEAASVEVTFISENQYGPGKTYTITSFK
ncbi:hypothetical protein, partial [uncultured Microbulbifer sp.]|uniref:hypothetical protein n=1 Tax=uncultured Microbulbifer sp. TaxID=348147 RepID=UPI002603CD8D